MLDELVTLVYEEVERKYKQKGYLIKPDLWTGKEFVEALLEMLKFDPKVKYLVRTYIKGKK